MEDNVIRDLISHERELREKDVRSILHERELRVISDAHERELRLIAEDAVEKARSIQFSEYARRLADLNHAHEQAKETAHHTVPREVFENYIKENSTKLDLAFSGAEARREQLVESLNEKINVLSKRLAEERNARAALDGSIGTWKFIAGLMGLPGMVALILGLFLMFSPK